MKAHRIPVDSDVYGAAVLAIDLSVGDVAPEEFAAFEADYIATHRPRYVSCKLPLDQLAKLHVLEAQGFRFAEAQIRTVFDLTRPYEAPRYPYAFERVTTEAALAGVLEIAGTTFAHSRFTLDPELDPALSGERYRRYVRQSFENPDEAVFRLFDPTTDRTVGFKTHKYVSADEALLLQGGVAPALMKLGIGVANSYAELDVLKARGIKRAVTHISAANHHVFNVEIGKLGFRVVGTYAVLRKIYAV